VRWSSQVYWQPPYRRLNRSPFGISDVADGVLLLNPEVVSDDGEWEAWFFAAWLPGATRYRSFWDLMHGERERYRSLR
jgi:hypothetical protein